MRHSKTQYDYDSINTLNAKTLYASNFLSTIYPWNDFIGSGTFQGTSITVTSAHTSGSPYQLSASEFRPNSYIRLVPGSPTPSGTVAVKFPTLAQIDTAYTFPIGSSFQILFNNGTTITAGNATIYTNTGISSRLNGTGATFNSGTATWNTGATNICTIYRLSLTSAYALFQATL